MNKGQTGSVHRRGRPRTRGLTANAALARRNLLIDPQAVEQLRLLYGAASDSEAIRRAVDLALLAAQAEQLGAWLSTRGGPADAYQRTAGTARLPVHLRHGDEPDQDTRGTVAADAVGS